MNFGALLTKERVQAKLSQQALAAKCGVSPAYIYRMEKGGIAPPAKKMCRTLAKAMGIDDEVLLKPALKSRLRRWLAKEGYSKISESVLGKLVETVEKELRTETPPHTHA
jgi:transcriptional regulator with XRE-family HTH domain